MSELKCNECNLTFRTTKGLELHNKVYHTQTKTEPKKEEPKKDPVPKKVSVKKTKAKEDTLTPDQMVKLAREKYKETVKKMRKKPIELKVGQKLSAKKLMQIMKHDPEVRIGKGASRLRAKPWTTKPLSQWIGRDSFKVMEVRSMKNDWVMYRLESKRLVIRWKEGPIKSAHKIAWPHITARLDE
tara:strand:+ start:237 stop:791 length:555 start_codon:yes stop_codon:yes gene_type:complete